MMPQNKPEDMSREDLIKEVIFLRKHLEKIYNCVMKIFGSDGFNKVIWEMEKKK